MDLNVQVSQSLPTVEKRVTQEQIERYASASGDFNPIHVDHAFASQTPFRGTIAHGMMVLAFVSEMLTRAFEKDWLEKGRLKVRFRGAVFPGDTVTTFGQVNSIQEVNGARHVVCAVGCCNQKGDEVITGEARVEVSRDRTE